MYFPRDECRWRDVKRRNRRGQYHVSVRNSNEQLYSKLRNARIRSNVLDSIGNRFESFGFTDIYFNIYLTYNHKFNQRFGKLWRVQTMLVCV